MWGIWSVLLYPGPWKTFLVRLDKPLWFDNSIFTSVIPHSFFFILFLIHGCTCVHLPASLTIEFKITRTTNFYCKTFIYLKVHLENFKYLLQMRESHEHGIFLYENAKCLCLCVCVCICVCAWVRTHKCNYLSNFNCPSLYGPFITIFSSYPRGFNVLHCVTNWFFPVLYLKHGSDSCSLLCSFLSWKNVCDSLQTLDSLSL